MSELVRITSLHFCQASLFFKHYAFHHEGEYRFLGLYRGDEPAPDVRERMRAGQKVRYRELLWRALAPTALRGIRIGPAESHKEASEFAKKCLATARLSDVRISSSSIPLRV